MKWAIYRNFGAGFGGAGRYFRRVPRTAGIHLPNSGKCLPIPGARGKEKKYLEQSWLEGRWRQSRRGFCVRQRVTEEERGQGKWYVENKKSKKSGEKDERRKSGKETKMTMNIVERNGREVKRYKDMAGFWAYLDPSEFLLWPSTL